MITEQQLIEKLVEVDKISSSLNLADRVVCMSKILVKACKGVGVDPQKIRLLGNRVVRQRFQPTSQFNYDPSVIRTLFVGRLVEQKNIPGITEALACLKRWGWNVKLEICGGIQMNDYLREALMVLEREDWHYHGSVPNRHLPKLYQQVDMYVGPSFFEGFQIPLIEALSSGKPCVVSDQPPANEIISNEVGALADPDEPASIADAILRVKEKLNDPHQHLILRSACIEKAAQKWDYFVISRKEVEIYRELLETPSYCLNKEFIEKTVQK